MTRCEQMNQIVDGGYCIGCGACCVAAPGITVKRNEYGMYQAAISAVAESGLARALGVCPFSDKGPNEDVLGGQLFNGCAHDARIGYYRSLDIGHVAAGDFRERGTSGGMISWLGSELLTRGLVDGVVHIKKASRPTAGTLFEYGVSTTPAEVLEGSKSRYYPIEMSGILEWVKTNPGTYAIVGLPCFITAVRKLMQVDAVFQERIRFCIGLVCGHLKSSAFADCFAWQMGIEPGQLEAIDFRVKQSEGTAGNYAVYVKGAGKEVVRPTRQFFGADWGHNFFRYPACDFCDDVLAETADISIGDAWLPNYEVDPKGTSIVVVRNETLLTIVRAAQQEGVLCLTASQPEEIAASQGGGLRDRREGLAYRLYLKATKHQWVPPKRVEPNRRHLTRQRARIYKARSESGHASHSCWKEALEQNNFGVFETCMQPYVEKIQHEYRSFWQRSLFQLRQWAWAWDQDQRPIHRK